MVDDTPSAAPPAGPAAPSLRRPRRRALGERSVHAALLGSGLVAIAITVATAWTFVAGSLPFFRRVALSELLLDVRWAPITHPASFGALALLADTIVITAIALAVALPLGLLGAIFLAEYCPGGVRRVVKPIVEVLGGIPTVVFGFFALRFVTPWLERTLLPGLGFWNGLSAGLVMGFMILPIVVSLSEEVIGAVPRALREAAYALGATRFETTWRVVVPAALSGVGAAFILAASRAIGETMIVALAAGRTPAWPPDPTQPMMTLTTSIVNIATGDHEATAFVWSAIFAIGLVLFVMTLGLNVTSHWIVRRFRERSE